MTLRQHMLTVVATVALLSATAVGADNQNVASTNVSVTIVGGGPLIAWASATAAPSFLENDPTLVGCAPIEELTLAVRDKRGVASGWSVFMTVQDSSDISKPEDRDLYMFWPRDISVRAGNPDLAGHSVQEAFPETVRTTSLWSTLNQYGDGAYALGVTSTLTTSHCDTFQGVSTLTVSILGKAP